MKTWKAIASWPLAPCDGPTGIAYDKASNRIFSGCSKTSVVVDASTGKVVASITNGTRVDALGWDAAKKLIYIPNGGEGNVTVVHQDSPDKYTVVETVPTFAGAKTITVDPATHNAYLFQPERGPAPPPAPTRRRRRRAAVADGVLRDRSSLPGSSSSLSSVGRAVDRRFVHLSVRDLAARLEANARNSRMMSASFERNISFSALLHCHRSIDSDHGYTNVRVVRPDSVVLHNCPPAATTGNMKGFKESDILVAALSVTTRRPSPDGGGQGCPRGQGSPQSVRRSPSRGASGARPGAPRVREWSATGTTGWRDCRAQ